MEYAGAPEYERDESLAYLPAKNIKRWRRARVTFVDVAEILAAVRCDRGSCSRQSLTCRRQNVGDARRPDAFTFGVGSALVLVGEYAVVVVVGYEAAVSGVKRFFLALAAFAGSHCGDADLASAQLHL